MLWATLFVLAAFMGGVGWYALRGWRHLGTPAERATYETLHTASLAAPALRAGLTEHSAERAVPFLRRLLATHDRTWLDMFCGNADTWPWSGVLPW